MHPRPATLRRILHHPWRTLKLSRSLLVFAYCAVACRLFRGISWMARADAIYRRRRHLSPCCRYLPSGVPGWQTVTDKAPYSASGAYCPVLDGTIISGFYYELSGYLCMVCHDTHYSVLRTVTHCKLTLFGKVDKGNDTAFRKRVKVVLKKQALAGHC